MAIDLDDIKRLIDLAAQTGVATLDVTADGMRVRIETAQAVVPAQPAVHAASLPVAAAPSVSPVTVSAQPEGMVVRAPTDGLIHLSPSPGAAPFVAVGQAVQPGETLCLIEVMKMFYPVTAPAAGTVRAIRTEDGRQVGFDEVLLELA